MKGRIPLIRYIVLGLILPIYSAQAYEPKRALNNLAHEFAECAAFYSLSSRIFEAQEPQLAKRTDQAAMDAMVYSNALTSEKLTNARVEMAVKSMIKDMDNDVSNVSIILNKYSDSCGQAMTDPKARMYFWLEKQD